jgi:hypothetical protein
MRNVYGPQEERVREPCGKTKLLASGETTSIDAKKSLIGGGSEREAVKEMLFKFNLIKKLTR